MRNSIFLKAALIFILASASANCIAQDYVVTTKTDTIYGNVKPSFAGQNSKVQLTTSDKMKKSYSLFEVRAFVFKNETYHPMKGPNGYTFMQLKKPGYLSYYAFQLENQVTFDGYYLTKMDGTGIEVPNLGFKKSMAKFLSDCNSVVNKIENGNLGKRDIDEIVNEYNAYVQSKSINDSIVNSTYQDQIKKISAWDVLAEKITTQPDFEGKQNALEMITDVKGKISRGEKVPNFLTEGLKSIINATELKTDLENALKELN